MKYTPYLVILTLSAITLGFFNIDVDSKILDKLVENETTIFAAIFMASVTILAITFTVSQFIISRITDSYSPYISQRVLQDPQAKVFFYGFLIVTILSVLSLTILNPSISKYVHHNIILGVTMGFIGTLTLHSRNFFSLMEVLDPIKFSDTITNMIKNEFNKHGSEYENLIAATGNIAINFMKKNETGITNKYVEKLNVMATIFLNLKKDYDVKYTNDEKPHDNEYLFYYDQEKTPITLILIQLERIFKFAYSQNDSEVTKKILDSLEKILEESLENPNNDQIVRSFTDASYGFFLLKIQEIISGDTSERIEKRIFSNFLIGLPLKYLYSNKIYVEYLPELAPENLFHIAKVMIDKNDFQSFKEFIKSSSSRFSAVSDPGEISSRMNSSKIIPLKKDPSLTSLVYDLELRIRHDCAISDYNIMNFTNRLEEFRQTATQSSPEIDQTALDKSILMIKQDLIKYYVNSLIYQAFMWIGAYLIYKGKSYESYLKIILHLPNPQEGNTVYLNHPPIPENFTWTILSILGNSSRYSILDFAERQEITPFLIKYLGLHMLRNDGYFDFPSENELLPFILNDPFEFLKRWRLICGRFRTDSLKNYTKNLDEYIDLKKFVQIADPVKVLESRIEELQKQAEMCEEMIIRLKPLDNDKIQEGISEIISAYEKQSQIDMFSNVDVI